MRYAQKMISLLVLVLAASFGIGGCVLLYSDFSVQRHRMAQAEKTAHANACTLMQSEILDLQRRGADTGNDTLAALAARQDAQTALWRGDTLLYAALPGLAQLPMENGTTVTVRTEVLDALNRLAACGAVPQAWVDQLSKDTDDGAEYRYGGVYYDLNMAFCSVDSLGFVTVRWFDGQGQDLYTRASVTIDSRTGTVVEVWFSLPADSAPPVQLPDEDALCAFAAQAGLEGLGDWAAPADSSYTCALYSANGSALIAASTHPYTGYDADRCYYSLTLQAEM